MRYAYAITSALLLGGAAATLTLNPSDAQTAQNEPGAINAVSAPRAGAPMSFADMVARLSPAVVNISTTQRITVPQQTNPFSGTPFEQFFGGRGGGGGAAPRTQEAQSLGSGFLISSDGYIVTNNHVVSAGAEGATVESITVTLADQKEYKAKLVGRDELSDLAVLKIDGATFPFVRFGDSRQARVGDWVLTIGNPLGQSGTVTAGIVSALNRVGQGPYDRFIQTDAAINRGNSGGPMFDMQGNVIGINSQILSPTGGSIGIGFAIPAEQAKPIVDKLMKGQSVSRGYLGLTQQEISADIATALNITKDRGALVNGVSPNEPAARAGIRPGDVIIAVNGKEITPQQSLTYLVGNEAPGSRVTLDVLRDGKRQQIPVTLGTRPSNDQLAQQNEQFDPDSAPTTPRASTNLAATAGLVVQPLSPAIARQLRLDSTIRGVVVADVDPNSDAATKGLRRGVVIQSVNRQPVTSEAELARAIQQARASGAKQVLMYAQLPGSPFAQFVPVGIDGAK
ncbi:MULTISPECIES: Do family serine endopeptidase [unclassified Sphingomonas]|uniref:Do family serine endopeptidase n=1 Tax=unclassified Sphingomonas TaxID=196159 RepID=UPI0006F2EFC4|nr:MULTISPECIES: Do family serine endopeptidase [unclassified Sphingomonas]KQM65403.1 protease [Sphingomonas sp. Leaf16]KQN17005.1 protease [Sphingomonas sp. Leaf32]KQN17179.1 protease [Sphingomonas sp. Leaf29]